MPRQVILADAINGDPAMLDRFADRLSARKQRDPSRVLAEWKLWDHMDAILSLAVTDLVDHLTGAKRVTKSSTNRLQPSATASSPAKALDHAQKRDLLILVTVQTMNYLHGGRHRVAL